MSLLMPTCSIALPPQTQLQHFSQLETHITHRHTNDHQPNGFLLHLMLPHYRSDGDKLATACIIYTIHFAKLNPLCSF